MKQPKKLTRNQKELLVKHNLNPKEWMFVDENQYSLMIVNKSANGIKTIRRDK